ncbi:MAG: diguanylate cyclase [Campylobacterota bacterium]|nr:diguanylate cyclase [Campylobacterota bacterium]
MNFILIVDDSKTITTSLKVLINEELGYHGVVANTKQECADALLKYRGKFAAALLDLHLPDAPNGEVVDFVTKFDIPTIVLTGSEIQDDESFYRNKSIVDYVIKDGGFAIGYVLEVLKRLVRNKEMKVLVVDDSKVFVSQMQDLLQRYQLNCLVAYNGQEAMKVLKENPDIRIVFTDYNMPIMDGLELTRNIRKQYKKDRVSIIVTSGSDNKKIPSKFLKYGANDFLYKGFTNEEFYARLNNTLEVLELFEATQEKANKDFLTGMYNRRYLFDVVQELYARAKAKDTPLCTAIIDIDKFKNINDRYGHDIGDIAIKEVVKILRLNINEGSLIARLGGEEFCVVLNGYTLEEVNSKLEMIRKAFEENIIEITQRLSLKYTVSIGATMQLVGSFDEMMKKADENLYEAKNSGRNKVVLI